MAHLTLKTARHILQKFESLTDMEDDLLRQTLQDIYMDLFNIVTSTRVGQVTFASSGTAAVTFDDIGTTSYIITGLGDTAETFTWSSKTATGFTANSSNAGSTAVLDWRVETL